MASDYTQTASVLWHILDAVAQSMTMAFAILLREEFIVRARTCRSQLFQCCHKTYMAQRKLSLRAWLGIGTDVENVLRCYPLMRLLVDLLFFWTLMVALDIDGPGWGERLGWTGLPCAVWRRRLVHSNDETFPILTFLDTDEALIKWRAAISLVAHSSALIFAGIQLKLPYQSRLRTLALKAFAVGSAFTACLRFYTILLNFWTLAKYGATLQFLGIRLSSSEWRTLGHCLGLDLVLVWSNINHLRLVYDALFAENPYGDEICAILERCRGFKRQIIPLIHRLQIHQAQTQTFPQGVFDRLVNSVWYNMYSAESTGPYHHISGTAGFLCGLYLIADQHFPLTRQEALYMVRSLEEAKSIVESLETYPHVVTQLDNRITQLEGSRLQPLADSEPEGKVNYGSSDGAESEFSDISDF